MKRNVLILLLVFLLVLKVIYASSGDFDVAVSVTEEEGEEPPPSPGGGGGGGGRVVRENVTKFASINLINPGPISVLTGEEVDVPIYLENDGELPLTGISLWVTSDVEGAILTLSETYIGTMPIDTTIKVILNIKSTSLKIFGTYPIEIVANVTNPAIEDKTKTYLNIIDRYAKNRTEALKALKFARDLFKENPECLELNEFLDQAEDAIDNFEFDRALTIIIEAIQACRDAIAARAPEEELPAPISKIWFIIEMVVLAILLLLLLFYVRRRGEPIAKKEVYSLDKKFGILQGSLRKDISKNRMREAYGHYQDLRALYLKIVKTNIPKTKKIGYYKEIKLLHNDLIDLVKKKRG